MFKLQRCGSYQKESAKMKKENVYTNYSVCKAHMLPVLLVVLVDSIIYSLAALHRLEVQFFSFFLSFCLPKPPGMPNIILLFPLTPYSWVFTPAKMSSIILNNIPAHYAGLQFTMHHQYFGA